MQGRIRIINPALLSVWLLAPVILLLVGCGHIIAPLQGASVTPSGQMNAASPLKTDGETVRRVTTIAVPYLRTREDFKDPSDWRMYRSSMDLVVEELKQAGRAEVVVLSVQKQKDLGVFAELSQMIEEDLKDHMKKLGGAARADAVLVYTHGAKKADMGKAFGTYLFAGTVDVPTVMTIRLASSKTGQVIYEQSQDVMYTSGGMGIKNTQEDELKNMLRPAIRPLIADLTAVVGQAGSSGPPAAKAEAPPAQLQEVKEVRLIITGQTANVRTKPSSQSAVVGRATKGDDFLMLERGDGWYRVRLASGQEGWIGKSLVREQEIVKGVPSTGGEQVTPATMKEKPQDTAIEERLNRIKSLRDKGVITEEEYRQQRGEILKKM